MGLCKEPRDYVVPEPEPDRVWPTIENRWLPWSYEDYSIYRMYYNFPAKYSEDTKWPLFVCRYEDISNVRRNPARTPDIVSAATLDGTIYRFPYKKILEAAHQTGGGAQDEVYQ